MGGRTFSGKKFLELFDNGMTYNAIAAEYKISRNIVAGEISDYRRENNIPVKHPHMAKNKGKKFTILSKDDKKNRKKRVKALKACPVVDGVTKCPPSGSPELLDYFK